ncbi:uncharacterized protein METZ01_LOCUS506367, partial [marine metagenome]
MLNWDNPLENQNDSKDDMKLTVVSQSLKETSLKNNNGTITDTRHGESSTTEFKVISDKLIPINPDDKRVVNGQTDINQLAPFKYPWAWAFFLNANKNHWTPLDINMAQDVTDYRHKLTLEEKHVYENV